MSANRVRVVCGPRRLDVDGIRDYADRLASSLAAAGLEVEVDHDRPDAKPADVILLNYNPFSFGRRGFAPRLASSLRRARRRASMVCLNVHESYVPPLNWRWAAMGAWQRRQLHSLQRQADLVLTPVQPLAQELEGLSPDRRVVHLPVGSNLPDMRHCRDSTRERLDVDPAALVIASFGTGHPSRQMEYVAAAGNTAAEVVDEVVLLNLGAGARVIRGVRPPVRVVEPGWLEAGEVARHLAAADLFIAPFVDGVSTRRGTMMAALQHGLPVVGTDGRLTDDVLRSTNALTLVPAHDQTGLEDEVRRLATDDAERAGLASAARELYERSFDWPIISSAIVDELSLER